MFPEPARYTEQNEKDAPQPGTLPEGTQLGTPSRDLLFRLLEVDPAKRLRSLRTLSTIAFYKGYNIQDVQEKKVTPYTLLQKHFPNGAPHKCGDAAKDVKDFD